MKRTMEHIERGVMVMKDGKAWGKLFSDGRSTEYGWVNPARAAAEIHEPKYCREPTSVTYSGSPDTEELSSAKVVHVERRTVVSILKNLMKTEET